MYITQCSRLLDVLLDGIRRGNSLISLSNVKWLRLIVAFFGK